MKRSVILLIIGTILIISVKILMVPLCFKLGKDAFSNQDYLKARHYFSYAFRYNTKNEEYRDYYIKTLLKLPALLDVQKDIYKIASINLSDNANLLANKYIEETRAALHNQDSYIDQVTINGKVLHWNKQPIRVEVKTNLPSVPMYYYKEIVKAFKYWQYNTDADIKFLFNNIAPDITIEFKKRDVVNKTDKNYIAAYTEPDYINSHLNGMKITFYDKNINQKEYTRIDIYNIAMHEIGHALGIMGHSSNSNDIMYMKSKVDQYYGANNRIDFSERDINTFKLLYKICPNITNAACTDDMFYSPIVFGNNFDISLTKIAEAQEYIKNAPDIPNGYIDLADAYLQQKNYVQAENTLKQALEITLKNSDDKDAQFVIYYNLAVLYTEIKNFEQATLYSNKASEINSDINALKALIAYAKHDYKSATEEYKKLVNTNPQNIFYSTNLANLYAQQHKYISLGKILNQLVRNNPAAKDSEIVKKYKLLMFLFH